MADKIKKVQRGILYRTDGQMFHVAPADGKKFAYAELNKAVGGFYQELRPTKSSPTLKGCRQMYANEDGIALRLPPNPFTQLVCDMDIYKASGYSTNWRVLGNIIALIQVSTYEATTTSYGTIAELVKQ